MDQPLLVTFPLWRNIYLDMQSIFTFFVSAMHKWHMWIELDPIVNRVESRRGSCHMCFSSKSRKERKCARSHLMKNLPKTSELCRITRCSFFRKEKYSGYLKYAFKSRKHKSCLTQMGDFSKLIKERANGKKAEKVAYQVRILKVVQRSIVFTLMFTQITRT